MNLNGRAYIPVLAERPFQSEFQAIITESIRQLSHLLKEKLHSIYVYGSVAKGSAVPQQSDLDLCIILTAPMTEIEAIKFNELQAQLADEHTEVSKIDFDIGMITDVMSDANLYSWGYWLKHHCRCIYGENLAVNFSKFTPSRKIAQAVNGDFVLVLNSYIEQIENCHSEAELKLLYRAASRKLIRSTDILREENDTDWPESLSEYVQKFIRRYPKQEDKLNYFLRQSMVPFAHDQFLSQLIGFINWLEHERSKAIN